MDRAHVLIDKTLNLAFKQDVFNTPSIDCDIAMTNEIHFTLLQSNKMDINAISDRDIACCRLASIQKKSLLPICWN